MAAEARKKRIKAAPFIAVGAAAGLAAAGAAYFNTDVAADEQTARYREYTVSRGDITVGTQESGTLSMDREYVTFPCPGEVLETAVKEGQTVTEGDVLFRISPEDIDEYAAELKTEADNAEADLRSAEQKRESGIRTAEQTLETSLKKGEDAQNEYDLSNERQASDRSQSEYQLEKYRSEFTQHLTNRRQNSKIWKASVRSCPTAMKPHTKRTRKTPVRWRSSEASTANTSRTHRSPATP